MNVENAAFRSEAGILADRRRILESFGFRNDCCLIADGRGLTRWVPSFDGDPCPLFTVEECSSCMDWAHRLTGHDLLPLWASVLACTQSAGRGQFGRHWHSPRGNVYGALRVPQPAPPWRDLIPLLLAVGILDVLLELTPEVTIKWPNDILVDFRKVGGILVEERNDAIIAGIGLNVIAAPPSTRLREDGSLPAACLADFGVVMSPTELWIRLVRSIVSRFRPATADSGADRFLRHVEHYLAFVGETVIVDTAKRQKHKAQLIGLDSTGGIKVRTSEAEQIYRSAALYPVCFMETRKRNE